LYEIYKKNIFKYLHYIAIGESMFESLLLIVIIIIIIVYYLKLKKEYSRLRREFDYLNREFSIRVENRAREMFRVWTSQELERQKKIIEYNLRREYGVRFEEWKMKEEERIRKEAIKRSTATIIGRVGEQLAPLLIFSNYKINPKDMRFIGTPIDFIVFKGLYEGNPEKILFIEVKSGRSSTLTPRERKVKELVESGKVEWLTIHLSSEMEKIINELGTKTSTYQRVEGRPICKSCGKYAVWIPQYGRWYCYNCRRYL